MSDGPLEGSILSTTEKFTLNWDMFRLEISNDIEPIIYAIDNYERSRTQIEWNANGRKNERNKRVNEQDNVENMYTNGGKGWKHTHVISIRRMALLYGSQYSFSYDAFVFPYRMRLVSRFFHSIAPANPLLLCAALLLTCFPCHPITSSVCHPFTQTICHFWILYSKFVTAIWNMIT